MLAFFRFRKQRLGFSVLENNDFAAATNCDMRKLLKFL